MRDPSDGGIDNCINFIAFVQASFDSLNYIYFGAIIRWQLWTKTVCQKQLFRGVFWKKVFWKYAGNLQENTHTEAKWDFNKIAL